MRRVVQRLLGLRPRRRRRPAGRFAAEGLTASEALERFLGYDDLRTVIDVGSGAGRHAEILRAHGRQVCCVSLEPPADHLGDYLAFQPPAPVDGVWAAHVLEHLPNTGAFLKKCFADLRPDGVLAITVPPAKDPIVGGHLTLWNPGLLLYNLIVAGFDCAAARVGTYGYNVSVIVRKRAMPAVALRCDTGDIQVLSRHFPFPAAHGFDGWLPDMNW